MHIEGPQCKDLKNIVTLMTSTFLFKWEKPVLFSMWQLQGEWTRMAYPFWEKVHPL